MNKSVKKILLTTPDYPPTRIGGISTFVINLEENLKSLGLEYELFIWNNHSDIKNKDFSKYDLVLNAHFVPALLKKHPNVINFIHGGEILPYSKNLFKRIYKKVRHKKILSSLLDAKYNVFISEFSFNLFKNFLGTCSYERDVIFHNCINLDKSSYVEKTINEKINICCLVRDVPHKNVKGSLELFKKINDIHGPGAQLFITSDVGNIDGVTNISGISEEEKEKILKDSHLNFLLSLDHSDKGNVEGFGLTVLEAGKYGTPTVGLSTGGLVESIHHKKTGWNFENNKFEGFDDFYNYIMNNYSQLRKDTYSHTVSGHGLKNYEKLLEVLI